MRRVVLLALLALVAVPLTAWADIIVVNKGGTIAISNAGITSHGSHLIQFGKVQGSGLGTVNFSTGALVSGSIQAGGVFSSTGSSFVVIGNHKGLPHGVLFNGTFTGDIQWTLVSQHGAKLQYELTGDLVGQLYNGRTISGKTVQDFYTTKGQLAKGIGHISLGTTTFVPEPGTLGLLGTGLVGIAGIVRRRLAHP